MKPSTCVRAQGQHRVNAFKGERICRTSKNMYLCSMKSLANRHRFWQYSCGADQAFVSGGRNVRIEVRGAHLCCRAIDLPDARCAALVDPTSRRLLHVALLLPSEGTVVSHARSGPGWQERGRTV